MWLVYLQAHTKCQIRGQISLCPLSVLTVLWSVRDCGQVAADCCVSVILPCLLGRFLSFLSSPVWAGAWWSLMVSMEYPLGIDPTSTQCF